MASPDDLTKAEASKKIDEGEPIRRLPRGIDIY